MKDLKHMIYFEKLLDSACNDLVREAQKENRVAVGYTCFHIPEVLLNLDHCFSVRLRAPYMGSTEIATYYLASSACEFSRALLERAIEGGFQFLDAIAGVDICECMNRCYENMELLEIQGKEKKNFFISYVDVPGKDEEITVEHVVEQLRRKVLEPLHERYGTDISDAAMRKAVEKHNEICRIISEMGEMRKAENPVITGAEFHKIVLATYVCPEDSGAYVAADRFCYGSIPGRQEIVLNDTEDVLTQIVRINIDQTSCPRYVTPNKIKYRQDQAAKLVEEYHADGIIYEQMKFCSYWSFERTLQSHVLAEEYKIPTLSIDRPYQAKSSGQLRTRVQAFVESLEIKKIKARREEAGK